MQSGERKLTETQRELARHALGLPNPSRRSYRNHFVAGPGHSDMADWLAMVAAGAARHRVGSPISGGDDIFWLTPEGAAAALNPRERLNPDDFPALSAAQAGRST
jgi:hypothetical protein